MPEGGDRIPSVPGWEIARDALLEAPAVPPDIVAREVVLKRLADTTGLVAAVAAPAGYGKTSQVAIWAEQDVRPVSWVELGVGGDNPSTILALLIEALTAVTDIAVDPSWNRAISPQVYSGIVAAALGRAVARCRVPFVLVLDDLHALADEASIDLVASIVGNVPSGSTVVLVSRSPLRPVFARARLHPGIIDIGATELALDHAGVAEVLRSIGVVADLQMIDRIVSDTEGWPAAVRLVGLGLANGDSGLRDPHRVAAATGQTVADYVDNEWLRGLSPSELDFLVLASGLDWLSGAMCDHVLNRKDSKEVLHGLHENRLTVLPLDRHGGTYRMHRILRDVLLAKFDEVDREQRQLINRRASEWFENVGDIDRAVRHCVRANDLDRAVQLVDDHAVVYQTLGKHALVAEWISLLPRSMVVTRPGLCVAGAVSALGMGIGDESTVWVRMARVASANGRSPHSGTSVDLRAVALNALIGAGSIAELKRDALAAYNGLPQGHWRAVACEAYGALAFALGEVESARQFFTEGAAEAAVADARTDEAHCRAHLAIVLDELGDPRSSHKAALHARQTVRDHDLGQVPTLVLADAVSALAAANDGQTQLARREMQRASNHMPHFASIACLVNIQVRIALARTALLLGDRFEAKELAGQARVLLSSWPDARVALRQLDRVEQQIEKAERSVMPTSLALTAAERRVLRFLPTNLRQREIADRLFVSTNTVKTHTASIYRKLGAASRSEAVEVALAAGILPVPRENPETLAGR
ncbi:MAG: LuxR C-terminal-related transcriptional regulator [Acidimicrobiales bacterium]